MRGRADVVGTVPACDLVIWLIIRSQNDNDTARMYTTQSSTLKMEDARLRWIRQQNGSQSETHQRSASSRIS